MTVLREEEDAEVVDVLERLDAEKSSLYVFDLASDLEDSE